MQDLGEVLETQQDELRAILVLYGEQRKLPGAGSHVNGLFQLLSSLRPSALRNWVCLTARSQSQSTSVSAVVPAIPRGHGEIEPKRLAHRFLEVQALLDRLAIRHPARVDR